MASCPADAPGYRGGLRGQRNHPLPARTRGGDRVSLQLQGCTGLSLGRETCCIRTHGRCGASGLHGGAKRAWPSGSPVLHGRHRQDLALQPGMAISNPKPRTRVAPCASQPTTCNAEAEMRPLRTMDPVPWMSSLKQQYCGRGVGGGRQMEATRTVRWYRQLGGCSGRTHSSAVKRAEPGVHGWKGAKTPVQLPPLAGSRF